MVSNGCSVRVRGTRAASGRGGSAAGRRAQDPLRLRFRGGGRRLLPFVQLARLVEERVEANAGVAFGARGHPEDEIHLQRSRETIVLERAGTMR